LPDLKKIKINCLYTRVINEIIGDSKNYNGETIEERVIARLENISHGLECGVVGSLVYSSDTTAFFKRYKPEINELLADTMLECGVESVARIFNDKWEKTDPLALEYPNQELLAWFAYEEVAFQLREHLKNSHNR
jgi:hypothetical protein